MILACIDGGLFCVPAMILYGIISVVGGWFVKRRFKICKKKCECECHEDRSKA